MKKMLMLAGLLFTACAALAGPRLRYTINEHWKFFKGECLGAEEPGYDVSRWETVDLPHTWNVADVEDEPYGWYRGAGWYVRDLPIDSLAGDRRIFLSFGAANTVASVWVNGRSAGEPHIGGYTPFAYDVTELLRAGASNRIAVRVDNSYNEQIPPLAADFTFYGGIYRDVELICTDPAHFDVLSAGTGVYLSTPDVSAGSATVEIRSDFRLPEGMRGISLRHTVFDADGRSAASVSEKLKRGQAVSTRTVTLDSPRLWGPDDPYLYSVRSELVGSDGRVLDRVTNPLGVRTFSFDAERGFVLNGEPLKLIGTNRHQDYLHYGNALTAEMHRHDLKLMKEMGSNCLRISHYPHDPAVLEMCDRYGLICFEEIPVICYIACSEEFERNSLSQIGEMIRRDYNHPCIVAWNTSNEVTQPRPESRQWTDVQKEEYDAYLAAFLGRLERFVQDADPTRESMIVLCYDPVTNVRKGFHQAELIGYNKYIGWYEGELGDLQGFLDRYRSAEPGKPMFLSEYGAGADVRIHSFEPSLYDHSEEFQILYFKHHLKVLMENDFVAGATVWNFNDFNSESRVDAIPHINEKALVTADRRPKASYYYYKAVLSKEPFVSIPTQQWKVRGGREDAPDAGVCTQPVEVFANTRQVELFLNGRSLGVQPVEEHCAQFRVPYRSGENVLELHSRSDDGRELRDVLKIDFRMQPYDFRSGRMPFEEIAVNCGSPCFFNDATKNDYLWLPDQPYREGSWGYVGGRVYRRDGKRLGSDHNIMSTALDPLYQTQLRGVESYRFDVPDGNYRLTLLFAELDRASQADRSFDIVVNGRTLAEDVDLAARYGVDRAVSIGYDVCSEEGQGIRVDFPVRRGEAVLNGIMLRKVY